MVYCINPFCSQRENPDDADHCLACGNPLLINGRIRLLRPLRSLTEDPFTYTDIFEVEDIGTSLYPKTQIRVMKILKWIDDPKIVELLRRESIILQTLDHPGIPKSNREDYFTFTLKDNILVMHCLVMQKFEGEDLRQWIKTYRRISQDLALDWLSQLINILDFIHRNEYFHRDIKPDNIIHQPDGKIALIDFGGAREISRTFLAKLSTNGGTSTGTSMGYEITAVRSAYYSPLEQIHGQAVPQSDFYALGRTFVYLITGIPLSNIKSDEKTGKLLWRDKAGHIDKPLADLIDDLMAPFPGQRPQNTQIILQRIQKLPLQTKIQRITRSKTFVISALITSISLLVFIFFKSILPAIANSFVSQGEKLEIANDFPSSKNLFNLATSIHPPTKFTVSKFYLEQASRNISNLQLAKKYYQLAIKYNERDLGAYNSLAIVCRQLRELNCAIDAYKQILKFKPDWEVYYRLGSFYDDEGKEELAQQQYQIAIKLNNNAVVAINNLSRLKNLKEDYNQAAQLALEGLSKTKDPKIQATLYKNLGWARLMQRKYNEAEKYLQKAIDLDNERIDAVCLLSQTQEVLGKINETKLWWEACMIAKSNIPEVYIWRQQLVDRLINNSKPTN
ncbi:protein kinase domain-containing protein [Nostoc sp. ChiQUE01b]|uniref:protein kinase domain-containing protein n=1 Tax=Nostoc sp. ChiQUE01b TaxID=3075376 RepID=UPI002AD4DAB1|nr:tetratricopeptide repeat protein [Nostoc sp. ChiQUE01b]MDZ8264023.1 tetratricopeptide repeat protein [Nostoc sp. ChiQUE01b]